MSATTNAIGEDTRAASRIAWTAARVAVAVGSVWGAFRLLSEWWRVAEAQLVVMTLRLVGIGEPERAGDQILVLAGPGMSFSVEVGPWCSSLGFVLVLLAYATMVAAGDSGRRRRAFIRGAALVVIGNLVRIGATIVVGVTSGPGSIESFHDSLATGFAVLYVLVGFAVFVDSLPDTIWTRRPASACSNREPIARSRRPPRRVRWIRPVSLVYRVDGE
jgi:exosortase/archaeosortase family protein